MTELGKKIEEHLFGDITTNELSEIALIIKKEAFGSTITFSPKVFNNNVPRLLRVLHFC